MKESHLVNSQQVSKESVISFAIDLLNCLSGSEVYSYAVQDLSSLSIRVSFNVRTEPLDPTQTSYAALLQVTPTCFSQPPGNACVSVFDSNGQLATRTSTAISHSQLNVQVLTVPRAGGYSIVLTVTNRPLLDQFNLTLYIGNSISCYIITKEGKASIMAVLNSKGVVAHS